MKTYHHKQTGWLMRAISVTLIVPGLLTIIAGSLNIGTGIMAGTFLLVGLLIALMSSLTVAVDGEAVRWHFGPGLLKKQLPLDQVTAVEAATHSVLSGLGIRITPEGTAYVVAGGASVRIDRAKGSSIILSTDDAEGLLAALRQAPALKGVPRDAIGMPNPERPQAVQTPNRAHR
ncbi:MAG: hypothetical protein AAF730_00525 [Bacteroidota bacterium]